MKPGRSRLLKICGAGRPRLRLPRATVERLRSYRLESLIGAAPFRIGTIPALASVMAGGAVVALCAWGFPVVSAQPPAERPVLVTMLDRDPAPVPEVLARAATQPGEERPMAARADIPPPPPPAAYIASIENPALTLPFAQGEPQAVLRPVWGDAPVAASQAVTFQPAASGGASGDTLAFWNNVRVRVAARVVYPPAAARRGSAGEVVVRVRIRQDGMLDGASVATSSGDAALDRTAVAAVREAAPFPVAALGAASGTNALEALIPLRFELVDPHGNTSTAMDEGRTVQRRRG